MTRGTRMDYNVDIEKLDLLSKHIDELVARVDKEHGWLYYLDENGVETKTRSQLLYLGSLTNIRVQLMESQKDFISAFHDYRSSRAILVLFEGLLKVEYGTQRITETYAAPAYIYFSLGEIYKTMSITDVKAVVITIPVDMGYSDVHKYRELPPENGLVEKNV